MKQFIPFILGILLFPSLALAESAPTKIITSTVEEIRIFIKENEEKLSEEELTAELRPIVSKAFDFEEMSKRCLGKNWKKGNEEQRTEFVELFSDLLADNYLKKIRENILKSELDIVGEKSNERVAIVKTLVDYGEEKASIDYRLRNRDDGWRVYDVVIENIGLVTNYRSEFSGIIRKEGFDGLIKRLREK